MTSVAVVYVAEDRTLRAVVFDAATLTTRGSPVPIAEDVVVKNGSSAANFDFSDNGRLVYVTGAGTPSLVWVDRNGDSTPMIENETSRHPRLSPDGNRVAFVRFPDVWIRDLDRDTETRLTVEGSNLWPVWSPNGSSIAFMSNRSGTFALYTKPADLSGPAELLIERTLGVARPSWTPDGRTFVYPQDGNLMVHSEDGEAPFLVARSLKQRRPCLPTASGLPMCLPNPASLASTSSPFLRVDRSSPCRLRWGPAPSGPLTAPSCSTRSAPG